MRGERLIDKVPHGHWSTTTFVAGLRCDGVYAPMLVDGPMDGDVFQVYIEQVLCPTLSEGDIVIMDNLACHKRPAIEQAIHGVSASLLYLPPYSPDLNPIELVFSKLKQLIRSAAKRTLNDLWDYIASALHRFSAEECSNFFRHAGYVRTT